MAKRGRVEIDREKCKSCYLCVRACPKDVLAADSTMNMAGGYPVFAKNAAACIACGACYMVCPDVAIEVYELEAGE